MKVVNQTNNTVVAEHVIIAKTWREKAFGLLLYKTPRAMLFHTRFGIHTFGMKYPIDVVVLDKKGRVVKMKANLKPNRIFIWKPFYTVVLELQQGYIGELSLKPGMLLVLQK